MHFARDAMTRLHMYTFIYSVRARCDQHTIHLTYRSAHFQSNNCKHVHRFLAENKLQMLITAGTLQKHHTYGIPSLFLALNLETGKIKRRYSAEKNGEIKSAVINERKKKKTTDERTLIDGERLSVSSSRRETFS